MKTKTRKTNNGTDLHFGSISDHLNGSAEGDLVPRGGISAHSTIARHAMKRAEQCQIQTVACPNMVRTDCSGHRRS